MNVNTVKIIIIRRTKQLTFFNYAVTSRNSTSATNKNNESTNCDLVSQPNPVSNLRMIKFYVPENESEIERTFRLKREEIQKWNEEFWTRHNSSFHKERKKFIALYEKEMASADGIKKEPMSADKMSVFYKRFLDTNWQTQVNYNYEWYKKNTALIILAFRVKCNRLKRLLFRGNSSSNDDSHRLT